MQSSEWAVGGFDREGGCVGLAREVCEFLAPDFARWRLSWQRADRAAPARARRAWPRNRASERARAQIVRARSDGEFVKSLQIRELHYF